MGSQDDRWWVTAYTRGGWWMGVFGLWTLFAVLMAGHVQLRFGEGRSFIDWLATMLPFYWAWVPLMPPVVLLATRFDFRPGRRLHSLIGHLVGGGMAVLCHGAVYTLVLTVMGSGDSRGLPAMALATVSRHGIGDLATYAAMAGAILTLHQYRRAQTREREAARNAIRASRLEAQLSEARLDALQMQLHPHFLFNALNSISVMVLKGAGTEAITAIRQLAELLRVTLRTAGIQELPLHEELAFVQGYLDIEKIRFGDRLQVDVEVPADAITALVPYLILQPLVENAIIHGLRSRAEDGRIRVAAWRADGTLRLEVWDNGAGVAADGGTLAEGVGLTNTRARLRELYGDQARVDVAPAAQGGTVASIDLPYHTEARPHLAKTTA